MKKNLLLFVFVLVASVMPAQDVEMYSLMYHDMTGYFFNLQGLTQQRNGDIIMGAYVSEDVGGGDGIPLGNVFYKMSPATLTIIDSLFIADTTMSACYTIQNPNGEGNIRVKLEYQEDCDSTFLHIWHFPDNDLHADPYEDIVVPVCEGVAVMGISMVDCWGSLIMTYYKERRFVKSYGYDCYIARFGPEGTLEHQAMLTENGFEVIRYDDIKVLKESPLEYFQWGRPEHFNDNLAVRKIDSLFQTDIVVFNRILSEESLSDSLYLVKYERFQVNYDTQVIPVGGDDILVAAQYVSDTNSYPMTAEYGVVVAKFDMRTMQLKGYAVFNDYPGYYHEAQCMGLKQMSDGTVYFLYKEEGYPDESVIVVKMDTDLNVEWKRFCKTGDVTISEPLKYPTLFKDDQGEEKGIAWGGYGWKTGNDTGGLVYFFLNHDGTVSVNESGIQVRPYCFYPNPVQSQLQMQFSPDVQPKQVELYDLQGRLVRVQRSSFGSIDMSRLPAGAYMLRVTLEDEKVFSDKVVKE